MSDCDTARTQVELVVSRMSAERNQAFAQHHKRALAYVKIYAEERPALRERIESMQYTHSLKNETEPKRRGRKPKSSEALVFVDAEPH